MISTSIFKYKGFAGSLEISIEDGCMHGKVLSFNDVVMKDLITYEFKPNVNLNDQFKEFIDDYLSTCEKLERNPQ